MQGLMYPKPVREKKQPKPLARRSVLKAKKKYQYKPKRKKPTVSVMQADRSYCFLCGRKGGTGMNKLEEHHCIEGSGRRELSERYGLKVYLCAITCHREGPKSVHKNEEIALELKQAAQRKFEETHSREEWIAAFTKSYIEEE